MAIALRAAGAWTFGANSITPTIPAAQVTGDMMFLVVTGKPFNAGWSAPGDWTSLGSGASGTTAAGVDLGSMKAEVWYKEATSDTETNPAVTEGSPNWNIVGAVVYVFSKASTEKWITPVAVFAADETNGTALSFTYASDPGGFTGDYVMLACGMNTDGLGPLTTDLVPVWTGITFGTADAGIEGETTTGGDMAAHVMSRPVTSGTSSAAPTSTGTGTASGAADRCESVFVRARVRTETTKTQTALARITAQTTKTQTALARITVTTTKTQTALARITDQVSQTQTALARITNTVDQTQTALGRITATTTKTQTAVANITTGTTTSQTQTAIARITDQVSQTQSALARITDQVSQTQSALARITDQVSQTQTAIGRITDQVSQTQAAIARVTVQTTKTQPAVGRITDQVSQTQSAVGRITDQVSKTQTAIGNILIQQLKTQTALARIHATTTKTQTAVARIGAIAPSRPISGLTSYHWYLEGQWMGSQPTGGGADEAEAARIAQGDHRYMQKE